MNLLLTNFKIELPNSSINIESSELQEWLKYVLGLSTEISMQNPLYYLELHDCRMSYGKCYIDGKLVDINTIN